MLTCRPEWGTTFCLRDALNAGAASYLTKETAPDELVGAVNTVIAGERYLASDLDDVV